MMLRRLPTRKAALLSQIGKASEATTTTRPTSSESICIPKRGFLSSTSRDLQANPTATVAASAGKVSTPLPPHLSFRQREIPSEPTPNFCVLCDESFTDYTAHCGKISHQARHIICNAYVVPERHEAIMSQLWDHIQLDFSLVDQVNSKKLDRRRMKLSGTIGYLVEQGVLYSSVPHTVADSNNGGAKDDASSSAVASSSTSFSTSSPSTNAAAASYHYKTSERFPILLSIGESYLLYEAAQRVSKLMPKALADDVRVIVEFLTHPRQLRAMFELLQMETIIVNGGASSTSSSPSAATANASSSPRLSPNEKVSILLAMLGEMRIYASKDRKHTVTDKIIADELVLNVLANHCCENLVSELVHTCLQRIVDEGTPVWNEHKSATQTHLFTSAEANAIRGFEGGTVDSSGTVSPSTSSAAAATTAKAPVFSPYRLSTLPASEDELAAQATQSKRLFEAIRSVDLGSLFSTPIRPDAASFWSERSMPPLPPSAKGSWADVVRHSTYEIYPPTATGIRSTAQYAQVLPRITPKVKELGKGRGDTQ